MTIKAILWTYEKRTDGTADVKIYTYPPKRYHSTGIKVKPEHWDKKKGQVKKGHPSHITLNAHINRLIDEHTEKIYTDRVGGLSLIDFYSLFIDEAKKGMHGMGTGTIKKYQSTLTRLLQYKIQYYLQDVVFTDCTISWHAHFCRFLADHCNCNAPGLSNHTKSLKRVLSVAEKRKLHSLSDYKSFKAAYSSPNKVYLREKEIEKLLNVDLSGFPHLARERDRFLVSYYLLMRYGDSVKISEINTEINGKQLFYRYVSEKTNIPVMIPIKPVALTIIKRNKWNLGNDSNQEANRHIKQAAAMAGINEQAKEGKRVGPKWKFVTTHTARRSAATNMALAGVQIDTIAKLGGWEKIATLKSYLRASGVDVAKMAATLDFFK